MCCIHAMLVDNMVIMSKNHAFSSGDRPLHPLSDSRVAATRGLAGRASLARSKRRTQTSCRSSRRRRRRRRSRPRQPALVQPDIDERLHWLEILFVEQAEQPAHVDKVDETRVELSVRVQIPAVQPVGVVDVRVAPEHLPIHVPQLGREGVWEPGCFAQPIRLVFGAERRPGVQRRCGLAESVGWEMGWVRDFVVDPPLYVADVVRCRHPDWLSVLVQPGVGYARPCGHGWACVLVAYRHAGSAVGVLEDLEETV